MAGTVWVGAHATRRTIDKSMTDAQNFSASDQALVAPLIPVLRRFAWSLCHDGVLADDLVQDCLERAISRWHLHRQDGNLRAWLFTILYHEFVNGRRRLARRGTPASLDDLHVEPMASDDQEQQVRVRDILEAIERLPNDHRAVILLIAVEEFSYDEAAAVLGIPVGTVMSRLSRARAKLREVLADQAGR